MFLECKTGEAAGLARIGRVRFSKTGRTIYYGGRALRASAGQGIRGNYADIETGDEWWVSGPKKRGGDTLFGGLVEVDEDVRDEYWRTIRGQPACVGQATIRCSGKR